MIYTKRKEGIIMDTYNVKKQQSGAGIAGMILGIAAILTSCILIGGVLGFIGIILSAAGASKKDKNSGTAIAGIVLNIIALFITVFVFFSFVGRQGGEDKTQSSKSTTEESSVSEKTEENAEPKTEESVISEEEFKESCQEFNYKMIARNPDDYIGQNFVVDVKISQSVNGKWYSRYDTYYKAYTNDEHDWWMGDFIYIIDLQDKDSENYVNVLEDDIIRVYATFNGMAESKNSLTGTTSYEMSLDMHYCELLEE